MASTSTILGSVKTFALIAFVTALIWLLAESESLRTDKVQVRVAFHNPTDVARLAQVKPGQDFNGTVTLHLEGPTARVDALASALNKKDLVLEPGSEGVPAEPGEHAVSLAAALRAYPAVRDSGVTIVDADPATVVVKVDNLVTRDAKVRVDLPDGQVLESQPEPAPAIVSLQVPESALHNLPQDLTLSAPIDADMLKSLPEARRSQIKVPLELPEALRNLDGVRLKSPSVTVTLTVRARTDSVTLPTVPIHLRIAPTEIGLWDIQIPENARQLTNVKVLGPSDKIAEIKSGSAKPIAFVPLSFEELEKAAASGQPLQKEPAFTDLPTSLKFEIAPGQRTIQLTVKRREVPAPVPGAPASPPLGGKDAPT